MTDKKLSCAVVQDLLPLYVDGVCSDESKHLVEAHLAECADCRALCTALKESEAETLFQADTKAVLKAHAKRQSKLALAMGVLIAVFLTAIMGVMLYVTLRGWSDWQTTVTVGASLLLLAGLTAVPLLAKTKHTTKAIVFSTLALVAVIYCEEIFFSNDGWMEMRQADLPMPLCNHKLFITLLWDSLWFVFMMLLLAFDEPTEIGFVMVATLSLVAVAWLIALTARYLPVHWLAKCGVMVVLVAIWLALGVQFGWAMFDGVKSPVLVGGVGVAMGAVLAIIGAIIGNRGKCER